MYEKGDTRRLGVHVARRAALVLADLDAAREPADLDVPGNVLHPLTGNLEGFWSIRVSRNWRIIFRFSEGDACDVDLVDYH